MKEAFLYTEDADEIANLRERVSFGRTAVAGSETKPPHRIISPNWEKWKIGGMSKGSGTNASISTILNWGITAGAGSSEFATGVRYPLIGAESSPWESSASEDMIPHCGVYAWVLNLISMMSDDFITFTGKPGATADSLKALASDQGYWSMNIEEVEMGILRPYYVMNPLVNRADYAQCGFYYYADTEYLVDDTGVNQPDRWAHWLKNGLREPDLIAEYTKWGYDNVWATAASDVLDGLLFVGDALGLTPETHFSRFDIAHFNNGTSTNTCDDSVARYPVKPFVSRATLSMRYPISAAVIAGRRFDASTLTMSIAPSGNYEIVEEIETVLTGSRFVETYGEAYRELTAWAYILPHLMYDEDHPFAESLRGYIEEAANRMDAMFNGRGGSTIIKDCAKLTSIGGVTIDEAIKRILKVQPPRKESSYADSTRTKDKGRSFSRSPSRDKPARSWEKRDSKKTPFTSTQSRDKVSFDSRGDTAPKTVADLATPSPTDLEGSKSDEDRFSTDKKKWEKK
jgi:hypothetical protein